MVARGASAAARRRRASSGGAPLPSVADRRREEEEGGKRAGCASRREISQETKDTYVKAFLVWLLFTMGGCISIPSEFLPLFSHCTGFSFFILITTRKTRWLGAIAVGGLVFTVLLYQTFPVEWISLVTQSTGYLAIAITLVVASLWRVVPSEYRREFHATSNEMLARGSVYLRDLAVVLGSKEGAAAAAAAEGGAEGGGGGGGGADAAEPLVPGRDDLAEGARRVEKLLEGVAPSNYRAIIAHLDGKLIETESRMEAIRRGLTEALVKNKRRLEEETAERLRAEKAAARAAERAAALKAELAAVSRAQRSSEREALRRELEAEREQRERLRHNLDMEKGTRQMIEKDLSRAASERGRMEKLLRTVREQGKSSEQAAENIRKTLTAEMEARRRAAAEAREACAALREERERREREVAAVREEARQGTAALRAALEERSRRDEVGLLLQGGGGLESLPASRLKELERMHEEGLRKTRELHERAVELEVAQLKEKHEELQDKLVCRVCLVNPIGVLLVECGHMCLCATCAPRMKNCPICRVAVRKTLRVYT